MFLMKKSAHFYTIICIVIVIVIIIGFISSSSSPIVSAQTIQFVYAKQQFNISGFAGSGNENATTTSGGYRFNASFVQLGAMVRVDNSTLLVADARIIAKIDMSTGFVSPMANIASPTLITGLAVAGSNLYITTANCVKRVNYTQPENLTLFAGSCEESGLVDGSLLQARFSQPAAIVAACNNATNRRLFIADSNNNHIRVIALATGRVSSVGVLPSSPQQHNESLLLQPQGLALDAEESFLYISDSGHNCIKRLEVSTGIISAFAGCNATAGLLTPSNSTLLATRDTASFNNPTAIAFDQRHNNLWVCDTNNNLVRRIDIDIASETVQTVAMYNSSYPAVFNRPQGVVASPLGDVFVAETGSDKIHLIARLCNIPSYFLDGDGDGYPNASVYSCLPGPGFMYVADISTIQFDCDDHDSYINPRATEVCDNVDNNCNGYIDEGLEVFLYYRDEDGDGHGRFPVEAFCTSVVPPGYAQIGADCDDHDPLVNRAAREICDLRDNNCDGEVDERLPQFLYYADHDGDGLGDCDQVLQTCMTSAPPKYVLDCGDCDDHNATVGACEAHSSSDEEQHKSAIFLSSAMPCHGESSDAAASSSSGPPRGAPLDHGPPRKHKPHFAVVTAGVFVVLVAAIVVTLVGALIIMAVCLKKRGARRRGSSSSSSSPRRRKNKKPQQPCDGEEEGTTVAPGMELQFVIGKTTTTAVDRGEASNNTDAEANQRHRARRQEGDDASIRPFKHTDTSAWEIKRSQLKMVSRLGHGGFSVVYKCEYKDDYVAFKSIVINDESDPRRMQHRITQFENEVRLCKSLRHPNIVAFRGAVLEMPEIGIVTEYMEAGSLYGWLYKSSQRHLSWTQKLKVLRDTACALQYLHNMDIIHRDLKSANILLSRFHESSIQAKISDFGLSKYRKSSGSSSSSSMISSPSSVSPSTSAAATTTVPAAAAAAVTRRSARVGTSLWMAPEIAAGKAYDHACDVYSFGMVMYEVLTERLPFDTVPNSVNIEERVAVDPNFRPYLDEVMWSKESQVEFIKLMKQCWQYNPCDRPKISDVVRALQTIAELHERSPRMHSQELDDYYYYYYYDTSCQVITYSIEEKGIPTTTTTTATAPTSMAIIMEEEKEECA